MEQKDIKQLIKAIIAVGVLLLLIVIVKPQNYIKISDNPPAEKKPKPLDNGCFIFLTLSQHGDINLPVGTIFGYPTETHGNIYDIIRDDTFIMSAYLIESFEKDFRCFETEEEAVAAGYTKFLTDQAARKKRREEAKKFLDELREGGSATDTAKTLQSIDAMIGF